MASTLRVHKSVSVCVCHINIIRIAKILQFLKYLLCSELPCRISGIVPVDYLSNSRNTALCKITPTPASELKKYTMCSNRGTCDTVLQEQCIREVRENANYYTTDKSVHFLYYQLQRIQNKSTVIPQHQASEGVEAWAVVSFASSGQQLTEVLAQIQ